MVNDLTALLGDETPTEVAQLINQIIANNSNKDLSNLTDEGNAKFSNLQTNINTVSQSVSNLTTTVNGKLSATVSKAANGYIKFNNGVIVQWGRVEVSTSGTVVTFPTAYTNSNYRVCGNCTAYREVNSATGGLNTVKFGHDSATKFSIDVSTGYAVDWHAIGY